MTKAQEKYTKTDQTQARKAQDIQNEPKTHQSEVQGEKAGGLHPAAVPPRVEMTTGNVEELQGQLMSMHKAIESIEVQASHIEQMVAAKDATQQSPANTAQVAPFDESATLGGRLAWLNHRLHTANDRITQALGRLRSL